MPKGGSGFLAGAGRAAGNLLKHGAVGSFFTWRMGPGADVMELQEEMVDLFQKMYRRLNLVKDSRGKVLSIEGPNSAMKELGARVNALSRKMADNLEVYDEDAAREYSNLRSEAGRMRMNSAMRREISDSLRNGDKMLIRGGRYASDAGGAANEGRYSTDQWNNTNIAREINESMNAAKRNIWRTPSKEERKAYRGDMAGAILDRYARVERAAQRRRRK